MAWVWLVIRVYVGWQWLHAGWGKVTNSAWVGSDAGTALSGFLNGALKKAVGDHPDVSAWYAWLINHIGLPAAPVISYVVAFGEVVVGLALILGIFTGIAARLGAFMSVNFLLAGTVSINPQMLILQIFLIAARHTAGIFGLDRFVPKFRK